MNIAGLQKLTLLDYPGLTACVVFTPGCNFRCPYCHNASLVIPGRTERRIDEDEVMAFLKKRKGVLDGVVVTGGEPLLHGDLPEFLKKVKNLGFFIKLDTNGSLPRQLMEVVEEGLVDYVAMDIKSSPGEYRKAAGYEKLDFENVDSSRSYLMSGHVEYEFRTTVVRGLHTKASLVAAARWISGAGAYYLQQFKDSGDLISGIGYSAFSEEEMKILAEAVRQYVPGVQLRGI